MDGAYAEAQDAVAEGFGVVQIILRQWPELVLLSIVLFCVQGLLVQ